MIFLTTFDTKNLAIKKLKQIGRTRALFPYFFEICFKSSKSSHWESKQVFSKY